MQRLAFLDLSKVIVTILVIFGHLYNEDSPERLYLYAFHMPFFFFVSGMVHKTIDNKEMIIKCINTLIIPAILFLSVSILCYPQFGVINSIHRIIHAIVMSQEIFCNGVTWFLFALFWVKILANIFIRNKKIGSLILLAFVFFYFKNFLFLGQAILCLPFYLMGYYLKDKIVSLSKYKSLSLMSIPLLWLCFYITTINGRVSCFSTIYGNSILLFYLNGVIGSLMVLTFSFLLSKRVRIIELISGSLISAVGLQRIFYNMSFLYFPMNQQPYYVSIPLSIIILAMCCICHFRIVKPIVEANKIRL